MPTCTFCKENYEFPRGVTVVQKDTSVRYFCSSKCRKNMEIGRQNKKVNWVRKSETVKAENLQREELAKQEMQAIESAREAKKAKKLANKKE